MAHPGDRSLILGHGERLHQTRALVRDRGSQFVDSFDEIFRTEGLRILRTPVRTPVANTFAERWIGTLRRELLDRTIIWNRRQLPPVPGPPSSSMSSPLSLLAVKQILSPLAA